MSSWRPAAEIESLVQRAGLLSRLRNWLESRGLIEVHTPLFSPYPTLDLHLEPLRAFDPLLKLSGYLSTSPEYAMKRLLAAGMGHIYQLGPVFRAGERGQRHNLEFIMLEYYRVGWSMAELMDELSTLLQQLGAGESAQRITYREAFIRFAGVDPFSLEHGEFLQVCQSRKVEVPGYLLDSASPRDELLNYLLALLVEPHLGQDGPCFLTHYPASQAALAMLDPKDSRQAMRFELYWKGVELANGYQELADAKEQKERFKAVMCQRQEEAKDHLEPDPHLQEAMEAGLPPCSGVALGVDRLVMLLLGKDQLRQVMAFDLERS